MSRCRARKRIYIGQKFPTFVPCEKNAREGHQTCWHHRKQEQSDPSTSTRPVDTKRDPA